MLKLVTSLLFLLLTKDVMTNNIWLVEEFDASGGSGDGGDSTTTIATTTTTTKVPTCFEEDLCDSATQFCKTVDGIPDCVCLIGYIENEKDNGTTCVKAKQFAGVFVFSESTSYRSSVAGYGAVPYAEDPNIAELEGWLDGTYNATSGYLGSVVTSITKDVEYAYTSSFDSESTTTTVTAEEFKKTFEDNIDATEATLNCTLPENTENPLCKLDITETKKKVGEVSMAACGDSCDKASTDCAMNAAEDGFQCDCKDGYLNDGNPVSCARLLCTAHSDCNDPFGTCKEGEDDGLGRCECMALFNGDNCEDPWLFIFVIVMSFIVFTGFIIFLWYCITRNSSSKKKTNGKSKYEDISMDSLQGFAGIKAPKVDKWTVPDSGLRAKVPNSVARVNRAYEHDRY